MADRDPKCRHVAMVNRVTSLRDEDRLPRDAPHRSVCVCDRQACVLDAVAWIERGPGIARAYVYSGTLGAPEWNPRVSESDGSGS